ncbi:carbohydrate-binding domain-containing protein [Oceanobacillus sojae]|uniref:carbohydrate-binding domain-containing protein n=1 Tax=Oceanobacillus sojae TaxID=582851 RepID=UPI000988886B|nr:carbohydrate-binding domain-containing protein [Oceanobacillus sojae]
MKKIICVSLITALILSACSQNTTVTGDNSLSQASDETTVSTSQEAAAGDTFGSYEEEDVDTSYDDSAPTIELSEDMTASEGINVNGQTVTITEAGTYVLSGELADGQVIVNVNKEEKVHLVLKDVTITNSQGPAILIEQAEKVVTTLADGTSNILTDGTDYQLADDETEFDAAFFSKEDLVINGEGELIVNGNYNNGIRSKDDLILISGSYTVNVKNNALKGKDSVQILDGIYTLTTEEGDGIQANNSDDETKGFIAIDGGNFTITSGRDGIQAETVARLQAADITIQTGAETISSEESYKGIKAGTELLLQSGNYDINSADDSLHSDRDITIESGDLLLASEDDGIHADNNLTINGGDLTVTDSNEGLEAGVITINDGDIQITASDDGLNASGDSGTTEESETSVSDSFGGPGGAAGQADDSKMIIINGGTLAVDAQGDGLDSNGNIEMSGGTVTVDGPTDNGNGALDYDGTFELSGGILITAGSNGMAMNVSESSSQASFGIYFTEAQEAGTIISLQDSSGNVIATYQPSKAFQHLVISSPELKFGETYTLIQGTEADNSEKNGYYEDGSIVNGIELGSLTLSDTITNVTDTGEEATQRSMMGGGPGMTPNDGEMPDGDELPNSDSLPNNGEMQDKDATSNDGSPQ